MAVNNRSPSKAGVEQLMSNLPPATSQWVASQWYDNLWVKNPLGWKLQQLYMTLDPPTERMWLDTWEVVNTFINVDSHNVSIEGVCLFGHWWIYESCKVSRNSPQKTGHSCLNKVENGQCNASHFVLIACSLLSIVLWTSIWYKKATRDRKLLCPILIPLLIKCPLPYLTAVFYVIVIVTAEDSRHFKMYM